MSRIGFVTAREFFERLIRNKVARVEKGDLHELTTRDCHIQQQLLPLILGTHGEETEVAIDHGDFKPENIIVDEDYNIKGYASQVGIDDRLF